MGRAGRPPVSGGELVPWTDEGYVDQQREMTINAARGEPVKRGSLTPLDAAHSGWLAALLEPAQVEASEPEREPEPGDDR